MSLFRPRSQSDPNNNAAIFIAIAVGLVLVGAVVACLRVRSRNRKRTSQDLAEKGEVDSSTSGVDVVPRLPKDVTAVPGHLVLDPLRRPVSPTLPVRDCTTMDARGEVTLTLDGQSTPEHADITEQKRELLQYSRLGSVSSTKSTPSGDHKSPHPAHPPQAHIHPLWLQAGLQSNQHETRLHNALLTPPRSSSTGQ
jgi:hypothetical protein